MNKLTPLKLGLLIASAAGCAQPAAEPAPHAALTNSHTTPQTAASDVNQDSDDAPVGVELKPVDRTALDTAIADLAGKVVLVDFWATWCAPCLAQLPHAGELARRHEGRLAVITVSMDEPKDAAQAARVVMDKSGAGPRHVISALGGGPEAMEAFEIESGSVPHYKLYDKSGKLRRTFGVDPGAERQFTAQDIDAAVAELLAE
jgi:thiol-disulfide isomerase/thioredoxin